MALRHWQFKVIEWEFDKLVFNTQLSPEIKHLEFDSLNYISHYPIYSSAKNLSLPVIIGIGWVAEIETETGKNVFTYKAEDEYMYDKDGIKQMTDITDLIIESFERLSKESDERKHELGVRQALSRPSNDKFDVFGKHVLQYWQQKGV